MSALTALEIRELTNFLKPFLEREYLDRVYPIGSLYFSATEVDPSALFGGTWERIKDRFLLASGDVYNVGSMGGSANSELIAHNHEGLKVNSAEIGWELILSESALSGTLAGSALTVKGSNTTRVVTNPSGTSNGIGKNMPPYLAICVWKRTA